MNYIEENEISINETLDRDGRTVDELVFDSVIPACCEEGCEVEPDGVCPHGCRSILLKMGII